MATTLFLRAEAPPILGSGSGRRFLDDVRGRGAGVTAITTTTIAGTSIPVTESAGGTALTWYTEPLNPVVISGTITVNLRGLESATTVNAGFGVLIERVNSAGGGAQTILADSTVPATITELGTVDGAVSGTYTPTSTPIRAGDRIKLTVKIRNVGTMAAGTATLSYGGSTSGAAGDSFVTFAETIQPYGYAGSATFAGPAAGGISGWW